MAGSVNKVILVGNLGRDPEVRSTQDGAKIVNLSIATSERWKDKNTGEPREKTEWHRVVFFNRLGEIAGEYLKKGSKIYVEGSLRTRKWQDKEGQDRYTTEIVGNEMQMLDSRGMSDGQSGPGGQSVNTTDSAVRVTHLPTGLVVSMQDEKSQLQNKAKALRVLRARLLRLRQEEQASSQAAQKRDQIKSGGRAEKIRTYNFKESRVTDHRIGLTLYKLERVLAGGLDEVVKPLMLHERAQQLEAGNGETGR